MGSRTDSLPFRLQVKFVCWIRRIDASFFQSAIESHGHPVQYSILIVDIADPPANPNTFGRPAKIQVKDINRAVWQYTNENGTNIYANRYTRVDLWGDPVPIDDGSGGSTSPELATDDAGNGFVVWERSGGDGSPTNIWTNRYTVGQGWGTPERLQSSVLPARSPSVAADPLGNAIAVWLEQDLDDSDFLVWARRYEPASGWGTAAPLDGMPRPSSPGTRTEVQMDAVGNAIALWAQRTIPMDGGRVLRAFLWYLKSDLEYATRIASRLGGILGIAFMALGLFSVVSGAGIGGFWLILIGFFVMASSRGAYESQKVDRILLGHTVGQIMTRTPITVSISTTITELVHDVILARNVGFVPVVNGGELLGYIDRKVLHGVDRNTWDQVTVGEVLIPLSRENSVSANFMVRELVERMQTSGQKKFLVLRGRQLLGVISLADIISYISLESELGQSSQ